MDFAGGPVSPRLMSSFSSPIIVAFTSAVAREREGEGSHAQRLSAVLGDVGGFGDTAVVGDRFRERLRGRLPERLGAAESETLGWLFWPVVSTEPV